MNFELSVADNVRRRKRCLDMGPPGNRRGYRAGAEIVTFQSSVFQKFSSHCDNRQWMNRRYRSSRTAAPASRRAAGAGPAARQRRDSVKLLLVSLAGPYNS